MSNLTVDDVGMVAAATYGKGYRAAIVCGAYALKRREAGLAVLPDDLADLAQRFGQRRVGDDEPFGKDLRIRDLSTEEAMTRAVLHAPDEERSVRDGDLMHRGAQPLLEVGATQPDLGHGVPPSSAPEPSTGGQR